MFKIPVAELDGFFAKIAAREALYLPVDGSDGEAHYTPWTQGAQLSKKLNTARSAKDFFFPQVENLMEFKVSGREIQVIDSRREHEDFVIFGVRACDARSFTILDKVYLSDPVDTYYQNRREHGTVITLACTRPAETCFCSVFGIDAAAPEGDARAWLTEEALYIEALTEKGEALLNALELEEAGDTAAVTAQQEQIRSVLDRLPLKDLKTEGFDGEHLNELFRHPAWASLSEACLACGTCTFVCPTCQCYDIRDFDTGHGTCRFRCWDSCMYSDFTLMAHGNPRLTQLERFRQRFMHKLVYFPANNDGEYGCVGCGRCLAKCPISMNIVKVMKTLGEEA